MMKRKRKNRIIIAWVLLMTLMPISIVKATHHHDIEEVASSQSTDPGQKTAGTTTTPALFAISFYLLSSNPNHSIFLFRTTYLCLYCATLSREEKDIFVVGNLAGSSLTLTFLNSLAACHVCKLLRCFRNLTPNFYIRKILTVSFSASNRLPAPTHLRMNASKQLF